MSENTTYPLSFLFVLVTICAVVFAILVNILPALDKLEVGTGGMLATSVAGGFSGGALGVIMGCYRLDRRSGILVCAPLGMVVGGVTSCLFFVDTETFPKLLAAQIGGAVLVLFLAAVLRFGIRNETD